MCHNSSEGLVTCWSYSDTWWKTSVLSIVVLILGFPTQENVPVKLVSIFFALLCLSMNINETTLSHETEAYILNENLLASSLRYKSPFKMLSYHHPYMADIPSTDTVKWHKTGMHSNLSQFSIFYFFFSTNFCLWSRSSQTIPRPGRVNVFFFF